MVPQGVKAVILLFPHKDDAKKRRDALYAQKLKEVGEGHIDPTVIWIKQTVRLHHFHHWPSWFAYADGRIDRSCFVWIDWKRMRDNGDVARFG